MDQENENPTPKQQFCLLPDRHKDFYLVHILYDLTGSTSVVFTRTSKATRLLALMLRNLGFRAVSISNQMTKTQRLAALNQFMSGECNILAATDVASRGLNIPSVDTVINYDSPSNSMDYYHRVGRTARAGRSGLAISLVNQYELQCYLQIETLIGKRLPNYDVKQEEVLLISERVTEARKLSIAMIHDSS